MSAQTLVEQIRMKDELAFESLYDEYNRLVYYVIFQIVKDKEATKDLVQDVFLTIYNKIDQYGGGSFKYWVLQIAKNLALNYYNRVLVKEENVIKNEEIVNSTVSKESNGLGKYDALLDKFFNQEEKDIIVYHVVFGYSYKDIAEIYSESPKVIGNKCRRLVAILKNLVKED